METSVFEGLLAHCAEKGVKPASEEELSQAAPVLKTRLKALLARSVLDGTAYWQIINEEEDPAFQRALEIIRNWKGAFPTDL